MAVILPAHVWYYRDQSITHPQPPLIGLLLEWPRVEDRRGKPRWEGLVAFAHTGGVETTWIRAAMLRSA
ncbi:hypothetical protein GCM10009737_14480 [Nocardioides lentus]|uniref:Uncharacterized protein n=1 Tax=Nocardioides lentus TaxID=338077 RepID=A0ABP5AJD5_9ACTN